MCWNFLFFIFGTNELKILTSIEDETWQQYAKMVENNQQFAKLIMKLIYKECIGFIILEHRVEVNKTIIM